MLNTSDKRSMVFCFAHAIASCEIAVSYWPNRERTLREANLSDGAKTENVIAARDRTLEKGDAVFAVHQRPVRGTRSTYQVTCVMESADYAQPKDIPSESPSRMHPE
jgi:hypothetical protein